jgi:hypothetical protein
MDHPSRLVPREVVAIAVHVLHLAVSICGFDFALSMNEFMPAVAAPAVPPLRGYHPTPACEWAAYTYGLTAS